jgi:glutathione S-transferase
MAIDPGNPLRIAGAPGSPYSRKLRAVLRYRRVPHHWVVRGSHADLDTPPTPVALMPVLVFPGENGAADTAGIDSTPLIRRVEALHAGRSVVPTDPALAFVDELLEDYADEWLTKAMFHYRWAYPADIAKAGAVLPLWRGTNTPNEVIEKFSKTISQRQIDRLWVVGSNETTGPIIEASYARLLRLLDAHLTDHAFVLGERPASSDFGLYGQLTQLGLFDPTPMQVTVDLSPRVYAWVEVVEDLSGHEWPGGEQAGWISRDAVPKTLTALLGEVGRVYTPFLLANADALARGAEQVECTIDGAKWVQKPFPYQGKCLGWLRESYGRLAADDRRAVDAMLAGTGCEPLFTKQLTK